MNAERLAYHLIRTTPRIQEIANSFREDDRAEASGRFIFTVGAISLVGALLLLGVSL